MGMDLGGKQLEHADISRLIYMLYLPCHSFDSSNLPIRVLLSINGWTHRFASGS